MLTEWGLATDPGRRESNEDAALAEPPVFVVADGMGGHARGEMASAAVVEAFGGLARAAGPLRPADVEQAVRAAADTIRRTMDRDDGSVAGTTVAGAVLTEQDGEPYWLVLNVGDSRVYRFGEGRLEQVSVDHSLVQELVDAGTLEPEQARRHPRRNVITRAVGTGSDSDVDFWMLRVQPGERLLLCTDGLTGVLEDRPIAEVLGSVAGAQAAAEALVRRAVADGADDNVTAVVVDVEDGEDSGTTVPSPATAAGDEDDDVEGTLPGAGA